MNGHRSWLIAAAGSGGDTLAVSAITDAELEFGARQSDRPDDELRAMRKVFSPFDRIAFDAVQAPAHSASPSRSRIGRTPDRSNGPIARRACLEHSRQRGHQQHLLLFACGQAERGVLKVWYSLLFLTLSNHASFLPRIAQQLDVYSATIRPCVGGAMTCQLTVGSEANALLRPRVEGIATC